MIIRCVVVEMPLMKYTLRMTLLTKMIPTTGSILSEISLQKNLVTMANNFARMCKLFGHRDLTKPFGHNDLVIVQTIPLIVENVNCLILTCYSFMG